MLLYLKDIFLNANILKDTESFNSDAGNLFTANNFDFEKKVMELSEESIKPENLYLKQNEKGKLII